MGREETLYPPKISLNHKTRIYMIQRFNVHDKKRYPELVNFCLVNNNWDFYYTVDNTRIYVTDSLSLKKMLVASRDIYISSDKDINGIILVWKSLGGDKIRNYIKFNVNSSKILKNLITTLMWNNSQELFIKIKKDSKYVEALKQKGFRFSGGRGTQILLRGQSKPLPKLVEKGEYSE